MEKLLTLSRSELATKYLDQFGLPADHHPAQTILAALYHGKRIKYLTEEEINSINELC